jgi:hypothetical protein
MKRAMLVALAGLTFVVGSAAGQDRTQDKTWMPGRYYLHPDKTGVHITHVGKTLPDGRWMGLGEVIETPPGVINLNFKTSTVIVELGKDIGDWEVAQLCITQPRQYCSIDRCWYEVDRYLTLGQCPSVPIQ